MTAPSFSTFGRALALFLGLACAACSSLGLQSEAKYEDPQRQDIYKNGSVASEDGGFHILGGDDKKKGEGYGLGVNGYLWRASLDTVSFMPIATADPFGGVITTDWYAAPESPNERIKMNIFILDRELRADGLRVTVFRQTRTSGDSWADASVAPATASTLEDTILTRARQMKLAKREAAK